MKVLTMKVSKEAIKAGLRSDAKIPDKPALARELADTKIRRVMLNNLLDDYELLLRTVRKLGVKVKQPTSVRNFDPENIPDSVVPAFLKKDKSAEKTKPEPKAKASKQAKKGKGRVRL